jgi:hypothetical protein|tara:strand:- start:534 stop:1436 length:903 start_codon:yes stop_codon:yes gene_type:complete
MAAVSTLVDRIYRDFLNKPDDLSAFSRLDGAINNSVTSLTYESGLFSSEEENLLGNGALVEVDQEIMLVTAANTSTRTLTVARGYSGTTAASHDDKANIFINPTFPRKSVFDAVSDNIVRLYPTLYNVTTITTTANSTYQEVAASTVEVLSSFVQNASGEQYTSAGIELLKNFPPSSTNTAVQFYNTSNGKTVYLVVKRKFVRPSAETDDLSTACLLEDEYQQIVMVGAVADIVGATDVDASTQEFITEKLAAENYPVGSGERLRNALLRLRSLLIDEARGNLRSLYPAPVSIMNINYSA